MRWHAILSLLALLAEAGPVSAAPPPFTRARLLRSAAVDEIRLEDLTGDGRPDILVQQSPGRELALFVQRTDGTFPYKPDRRLRLPDTLFAWCLAALGPPGAKAPRRVCGLTPDGILAFPPLDGPEAPPVELILFPTAFAGRNRQTPVFAEFLQDLDADGDVDALVPQSDGLCVFRQTAPGVFALDQQIPLELGSIQPTWGTGLGRVVTVCATPRVMTADLLGRGSPQILLYAQDTLSVHAIGSDGRFGWLPDVEIALRGRKSRRRFSLIQYQLPPSVLDLNGDGALDILHVVAGRGEAHLFLGAPGSRSVFPTVGKPRPPDDTKKIDGYIPNYWVRDLDGDGRQDLLLSTVGKLTVIGGLQIFLTRQVDIQLMAFLNRPGGRYPREPDFVRAFTVPLSMYATRDELEIDTPFFPCVDGDFNRDGRKDLVIKHAPTALAVYPGTPHGVFGEAPIVELPIDALYDKTTVQVADLNGDGVSDLVLHHVDWDTMFHDVEIFLSR